MTTEIKIIQTVESDGNGGLTVRTDLPQGHTMTELADAFKAELTGMVRSHRVRGRNVRFTGRLGLVMGFAAGFVLRNAKALNVDVELPQEQRDYRCSGMNDPTSPVEFPWDIGMVVRASLFGHSSEVAIISVSVGDRIQVERRGQRAWIATREIEEFIRYAAPNERV